MKMSDTIAIAVELTGRCRLAEQNGSQGLSPVVLVTLPTFVRGAVQNRLRRNGRATHTHSHPVTQSHTHTHIRKTKERWKMGERNVRASFLQLASATTREKERKKPRALSSLADPHYQRWVADGDSGRRLVVTTSATAVYTLAAVAGAQMASQSASLFFFPPHRTRRCVCVSIH